jgi:hypothetical protein
MLAVAVAALALGPAIPPEPVDPPYVWIASGPTGTVYETTAQFSIEADGILQCALDTTTYTSCSADYSTPVLGLGPHTLNVRARAIGAPAQYAYDSRSWTIAQRPVPTPVPTATPAPTTTPPNPTPTPTPTLTPTPTPDPVLAALAEAKPLAGPPAPTVLAAPLPKIDVSLLYFMNAKRNYTRFATLAVKKVPAGATITVTCKGGCPRSKDKLTSAKGGTVRLDKWLRARLKTGATLTITVSKPGMRGISKAVTMRAERRPRIVTKTLAG